MATSGVPFGRGGEYSEEDTTGKKRLSVERIYQRKTQLEHILLRPDTYIGSVEESSELMWVFDPERPAIVKRQITFVPGLYKIFDEILVNAADNKQRDPRMNAIKIVIDPESNLISVWNNGRGIPVEMHAVEKLYVPELIFGTLLTSSNYNDEQKKVTGGRNGYGAKLCNIFSTEFTIETACSESGRMFKQSWKGNMAVAGKAVIKESKSDYTKVTFRPDLTKFKMTHLDADTVALMTRRAYDIAGISRGVSVYLNGKKLPVKNFREYVELYLAGQNPEDADEEGIPRKVVHEVVNPRWEVCITASDAGFQQASFVNSIATTKGGTHVTYVVDQVVAKLLEAAKKKNKGGMALKPFHIRGHLWVFINCLVENPAFDSQTKENMTLKAKSFGSSCQLGDKFIKQALSCGVVERVLSWARVKSQAQIAKQHKGSKHSKLRGIPKLDDANEAGGRNSLECTLIITEGDSAKTLAVSGLGVVGRDYYGVFPLRGKLLNVREASHNQIIGNEEISNLTKIMGLQYAKKYADPAELRTLRYGRLMIMADQDQDGSHIKGLVINFVHHNWPHLLRHHFIEEFITPIVKVTKGQREHPFFSLPEFERWKAETENAHTWRVKYYKGLGTSTSKEAKEYFSDMERHRILFKYSGAEDDDAVILAFSKKCVDRRKEWLMSWLQHRREQRSAGLNESLLYAVQTDHISYSDFVNKELILFSNMDNERSIASVLDGLKPGQRKVLYTCFKRNDKREIKVAQLAGSVAEHSAYHHGEQSLMSTIVNLAQTFVGSNNVNLLQPLGQFGTRLHGGKDAASARYIFTMLSPLARLLFPPSDDTQLTFLRDDNVRIEPEWYCPILPTVLINGCEGIGTGYSTSVPNYDPREIVGNLKRIMVGMEPEDMKPWYKGFTGVIAHVEPQKYLMCGRAARLSPTTLEITELPIRSWTQTYKENVLEPMLHGTEKISPFITDYKEYHTDATVRFVVELSAEKMREAEGIGIYKKFKLEGSINTSNLVLFDHNGCLRKYTCVAEVMTEFYEVRLDLYRKRKEFLEGQLAAESLRLSEQARFIMEKIEGKVVIENKRKVEMIAQLQKRGYKSDPIKAWKQSQEDDSEESEGGDEGDEEVERGKPDYNYLLSMQLWSLTREKKEELLANRDKKTEELRVLRAKTPKSLWTEDLNAFMEALDRLEQEEKEQEAAGAKISVKKKAKGKSSGRQTKLTSGASSNSIKETRPSAFAEVFELQVPAFCAESKKTARGKGRVPKVVKEEGEESKKAAKSAAVKAVEDAFNEEDEAPPPGLMARLGKKGAKTTVDKQSTLVFQKASRLKRKAVAEVEVLSDSDAGTDEEAPPTARQMPARKKTAVTNYAAMFEEEEEGEAVEVKSKVATQKKQKLGSDSEEEWGGDGVQAHSSSDLEIDVISAEPKKTVQGKGRAPKGAGTKPAKAVMLAVKAAAPQRKRPLSSDSEEEWGGAQGKGQAPRAVVKVATQKKQKLGSDSEEEWGGDGVQAHSSSDLEVDVFSAKPKKTVRGKGRAPKGAGAKPAKATMLAVKVTAPQRKQPLNSDSEEEWGGGHDVQALSSSDLEIPKLSAEPKKAVKGKGRAPKAPAKGTGAKRAKTMKLSVKAVPQRKQTLSSDNEEEEEGKGRGKQVRSSSESAGQAKRARKIVLSSDSEEEWGGGRGKQATSSSDSAGRAKRARKEVKYVVDEEEEEEEDWRVISSGSDSDF